MYAKRVARFTREQADQKVGRRVHSLVEFSGVPFGTHGTVVGVERVDGDCYDVVVEWEPPARTSILKDRFAKETYEELLAEEECEHALTA